MALQVMSAQDRLDHMRQAIETGGQALYQGRTIGNVAHLPTLSELAETADEQAAALQNLEIRKKALADEEARLRARSSGQPLGAGDNVTISGGGGGAATGAAAQPRGDISGEGSGEQGTGSDLGDQGKTSAKGGRPNPSK